MTTQTISVEFQVAGNKPFPTHGKGGVLQVKRIDTGEVGNLLMAHTNSSWCTDEHRQRAKWILTCYLPEEWSFKSPFPGGNTNNSVHTEYNLATGILTASIHRGTTVRHERRWTPDSLLRYEFWDWLEEQVSVFNAVIYNSIVEAEILPPLATKDEFISILLGFISSQVEVYSSCPEAYAQASLLIQLLEAELINNI